MDNLILELHEQLIEKEQKINELRDRIDKAIEYIEKNCIDDEFYVNLTNKEKSIIEALEILKGE